MRRSLISVSLLLVLFCTASGYGQNAGFGDIRGTVTDTLNALVPDVDVAVENLDTGVVLRIKTNKDGIFDTSSIIPGKYQVTFTKQGFSTFTRGPITLEAGFININAALKVGSVNQEIVVNNDVTMLNTESGEQSTTLTFESMNELPNYGVSWTNNLVLLPGAVGTTSGAGGVQNPGEAISINGVLPYFTNILQDGASVIAPHSYTGQTSVFHSVAEVQISTNSFSAEYGVGGIVMNQITKSGTKNYHGSAYYYIENDAFNAFPYEFTTTKTKPRLRYDHFGGTFGGPVLKKHLFVFFNYDRIVNNASTYVYETVPTPAQLGGDLSTLGYQLYDPATTGQAACAIPGHANARCAITGNIIPSNRIDPVAAALLSYYPKPNQTVTNGQRNYAFNQYLPNTTNNYFGRADYNINNTQRMFVSVTNQDNIGTSNSFGICPIGCSTTDNAVYSIMATHIWTISSKWLNEARMGMFKQISIGNSSSKFQGYPAKIGLKYPKYDEWPTISFTGGGFSELPPAATDYTYLGLNYDPSDVMTLIEGKHILHFGGEYLFLLDNSTPYPDIAPGTFGFNGVYTEQIPGSSTVYNSGGVAVSGTAGVGLADLLLGDADSWAAYVRPRHAARQKVPQMFFQDDYKVRPNLTLNLGVRYQIQLPWTEVHGLEGAFDPTVPNPPTNVLGALWFAQNGTNGRHALEKASYNIFLPRLGFAYQPHQGTSIRGGFGMYSYGWSLDAYGNGIGYAAGGTGNANDYADVTPITTLSGPGVESNGTPLPYVTNANGFQPNALNGQSVSYTNYHMPVSRVLQYNLSIGQELTHNIALQLSYVGSNGYDENFYHDVNQVPQADFHFGPTTSPYRPYPLFSTINGYDNNTISNYNSLQAVITKRFNKGFTFNANYTWSKLLDEFDQGGQGSTAGTQPYQNSYNVRANYGPSNFDHRNAFKASGNYELPFGVGKKWANHNGLLDAAIGGWRLSGTFVSQSGNPLTPVFNVANNSYALSGTWYPNVIGNPNIPAPGTTIHTINNWFNESAYQLPAVGTFGNAGRNGLVYGPSLNVMNASLRKAYTLPRNVRLEIRCDANNATNHTNFGNPSTSIGVNSPALISSTTTGPRVIQLGAQLTF
jgi:hypothetical protein